MSSTQLPDTINCTPCVETSPVVFSDQLPDSLCPCPVVDNTPAFKETIIQTVETIYCLQSLLFNMTQNKFCATAPQGCP